LKRKDKADALHDSKAAEPPKEEPKEEPKASDEVSKLAQQLEVLDVNKDEEKPKDD